MLINTGRLIVFLLFAAIFNTSAIEYHQYEFGFRADVNLSTGKPANDIMGYSLLGRYRLSEDWLIGFGYETAKGWDVERPNEDLGLSTSAVLDASADSNMYSLWVERRYDESYYDAFWFWTAGIGLNQVDVDNLVGTTDLGQNFNLQFDVDNEIAITLTAGRTHHIADSSSFSYGARLEQRLSSWNVTNLENNTTTEIYDNYPIYGVFVSMSLGF